MTPTQTFKLCQQYEDVAMPNNRNNVTASPNNAIYSRIVSARQRILILLESISAVAHGRDSIVWVML